MKKPLTPKAPKGWMVVTPQGDLLETSFADRRKDAWFKAGIDPHGGGAQFKFWKDKGFRCIRVLITPIK
jgi:hypothetical protein